MNKQQIYSNVYKTCNVCVFLTYHSGKKRRNIRHIIVMMSFVIYKSMSRFPDITYLVSIFNCKGVDKLVSYHYL